MNAQRAPSAEELYSNGLHVATASLETGSPTLDVETANRAELGIHWHQGPFKASASVYHVRFDDYIYLADTGLVEHDVPVRLWTQGDARFNGAEAEVSWAFADNASGQWDLRMFGDVVRAKLAGDGTGAVAFTLAHEGEIEELVAELPHEGNLPRIAPSRVGAELRWELGQWRASLGAVRYAKQDRVAAHELHKTPAAVSLQVKQLEENVGFALFVRHPRHIALAFDRGGVGIDGEPPDAGWNQFRFGEREQQGDHATSFAAWCRSTLTSWLMPRSGMVTP